MRIDEQYLKTCFNDLKVLVLGDVILDHYLIGKVDRISPEAPVPVVLHEEEAYRLGGAANVALNIKKMGAKPYLFSLIGADNYGEQFIELLKENEIDTAYILRDKTRKTTCKTRILARNQHLLRYDYETTSWIEQSKEIELIHSIKALIDQEKMDVLVFQDYNKGILTSKVIKEVLAYAQGNNIITVADPKKANFLAYKGVDLFKPNLREINEGLGIAISEKAPNLEQLEQAARSIEQHLNNKYSLITLGAKGMYVHSAQNSGLVATKERQIADVCGAGDTVISIVAVGIAAKLAIKDIVVLANIGGGQVCEQVGVVPVNREALLKEYLEK